MRPTPARLLVPALFAVAAAAHATPPKDTPFGTDVTVHRIGFQPRDGDPNKIEDDEAGKIQGAEASIAGLEHEDLDPYGNYREWYARAEAHASLATGTMGVSAFAGCEDLGASSRYGATATAEMWDTVTIQAGLNLGVIPLQIAIDGHTNQPDPGADAYAVGNVWVYDLDAGEYLLRDGTGFTGGDVTLNSGVDFSDVPNLNDRHFQIGYSLFATAESTKSLEPNQNIFADFGHTLHFRWDLAPSQYTAASGIWQPPHTQAVPEPATLAALGAGALGLIRRRRFRS